MEHITEDVYGALYSIGSEDGTAEKIAPTIVAKLIELKFVELGATGLPADELVCYPVEPIVNKARNEGPQCIVPFAAE